MYRYIRAWARAEVEGSEREKERESKREGEMKEARTRQSDMS